MQETVTCCECGRTFTNYATLGVHISKHHKLSSKEYYDKYLKRNDEGKCIVCGQPTTYKSLKIGYRRYCCNRCVSTDDSIKKKKENTLLEHYGVTNPSFSKEVLDKIRNTFITNFGVSNPQLSETVREKTKATCRQRYGNDTPLSNSTIRKKISDTNNEKYGGNAPSCSTEIVDKMKQTCLEKYDVENYAMTDECKNKVKKTCLEKYGVENCFASEEKKNKMRLTWLNKYGVEHPMQNHEIFCKTRKKYEYDGLMFDSRPEIEFYKKLKDENADFEYQPDIFFEYEYAGKKHHYYPDFRIGNEYFELKGAHFFDENGKMINPFDRSNDDVCEAKHQCMIRNNVKIIIV